MLRKLMLVLTPLLLAACGDWFTDPGPDYSQSDNYALSVGDELTSANLAFAFESFREIVNRAEGSQNIFYSPLSLSIALAMTYNGARGCTADMMREGMELGDKSLGETNEQFRYLTASLQSCDRSVQLCIANSIWVDSLFTIADDFRQRLADYYLAEAFRAVLRAPEAVAAINDWVSRKTNRKIPEMYRSLPDSAKLVLLNALYFKAAWKFRFDKRNTTDKPFYLDDGNTTTVRMMESSCDQFTYYIGPSFQSVRLPYGRDVVAMYIFLPHPGSTVDELIGELNSGSWDEWMAAFRRGDHILQFPKFKMEFGISLQEVLNSLGMGIIFTPAADFSGITGPGQAPLMVYEVKQKAFIEVNEEGTEAAAATGVVGVPTAPPEPFRVDRPFFFVIRDDRSGTVLFMGRIMHPRY